MAAWLHHLWWTKGLYEKDYRDFVRTHAGTFMGKTEDCADISMTLLIDFAASKGLPTTFEDNAGTLYISKATCERRG